MKLMNKIGRALLAAALFAGMAAITVPTAEHLSIFQKGATTEWLEPVDKAEYAKLK